MLRETWGVCVFITIIERECCLLALNSVTSTQQWIGGPGVDRRRRLYELRLRLMQVGEACVGGRKPECQRKHNQRFRD